MYGARQLWPVRLSPTRPQEVIDFEELMSDLITMAQSPSRIETDEFSFDLLTYSVLCGAIRAYDCQPSEINLHIDHFPTLGAIRV